MPDERSAITRAQDRVRRHHGSAIGRPRSAVQTPALLLDTAVARANAAHMAARLAPTGVALRPHVKTHKSPHLALLQLEAGAIGLSAATVWEAAVMIEAGARDIFVVNEVVSTGKIRALVALARRARVRVAVDDARNAVDLSDAAAAAAVELELLVDVDTGMDRCGVDTPEEALDLARHVTRLPGVRFAGITGYEGHCSLELNPDRRAEMHRAAMTMFVGTAEMLEAHGIACPIRSAGGTATWDATAAWPGVTELQAGSYLLMDRDHIRFTDEFSFALTVAATVVSRRGDRLVVDCGSKSMGDPDLCRIVDHEELEIVRFDEEHGIFAAPADVALEVGDVVELIPGYAPATVNLHDVFHVVEGTEIVDVWPVIPRGPAPWDLDAAEAAV